MNRIVKKSPQAPVLFGWSELKNIKIDESRTAFAQLEACGTVYKNQFAKVSIAEVPGVQAARQFFRAIGIDPTRRRPSSESLLNRALKNKGFFSVNTLVDVGNWCSLCFLLPICVYDAAQITGEIHIRMGRQTDEYLALNNREMNFENRLVIADAAGAFGSPMTDSLRTSVSVQTTHALLGIWAPQNINHDDLMNKVELFSSRAVALCGGECVNKGIAE